MVGTQGAAAAPAPAHAAASEPPHACAACRQDGGTLSLIIALEQRSHGMHPRTSPALLQTHSTHLSAGADDLLHRCPHHAMQAVHVMHVVVPAQRRSAPVGAVALQGDEQACNGQHEGPLRPRRWQEAVPGLWGPLVRSHVDMLASTVYPPGRQPSRAEMGTKVTPVLVCKIVDWQCTTVSSRV